MEVIEKETIKEVPVNYYHDKYNCGYNRYDNAPYASKGVAANAQAGIALEAERRCCADNKIVNYVNGNFYPVSIADVTTGTATTQRALSNPLCGCCGSCNYNN